jgi:DNA-binding MarR family transcriptional regulator
MHEIEFLELIGDIHRKTMKRISCYAEEAGLSITESMVLWRVHKHGVCRVSEISSQLGLPPSTLTGILDRLVLGGWLTRVDDPDDRRAVQMKSTPKLVDFTKSSMRASSRSLEKSFKVLDPKLLDRIVGDLRAVLSCLENDEEKKN